MAVGDIWEIALQLRNTRTTPTECAIITWHVRDAGGIGGANELAAACKIAFASFMFDLSQDVEAEGVYLTKVQPVAGLRSAHAFSPTIPGSLFQHALPTGMSIEVLRQTGKRGRQYWGRYYIPWTTLSQMDPTFDNRVDVASAAQIVNDALLVASALQTGSGAGDSWDTVVYSHRSATGGVHADPVAQFAVIGHYRSRGRRARDKPDCPPFSVVPSPLIVATIYPSGSFNTDGSPFFDGRVWHGQSDRDPRVGTPGFSLAGFSVPGYNDSWWNTRFIAAAYLPPCAVRSNQVPSVTWANVNSAIGVLPGQTPQSLFPAHHHYADSPTGDLLWAQCGENGYLRREFSAPAGVTQALLAVQGVDLATVFVNGFLVGQTGANPLRSCQCAAPFTWDVTALINSPGLNCLGLICNQYCEAIGGRAGFPAQDGSRNCCGYPNSSGLTCYSLVTASVAARLEMSL